MGVIKEDGKEVGTRRYTQGNVSLRVSQLHVDHNPSTVWCWLVDGGKNGCLSGRLHSAILGVGEDLMVNRWQGPRHSECNGKG